MTVHSINSCYACYYLSVKNKKQGNFQSISVNQDLAYSDEIWVPALLTLKRFRVIQVIVLRFRCYAHIVVYFLWTSSFDLITLFRDVMAKN